MNFSSVALEGGRSSTVQRANSLGGDRARAFRRRRFGACVALAFCAWVAPTKASAHFGSSLPPGFTLTELATQLDAPTCFAPAPDGRFFVGQLDGTILVYANGSLSNTPLIDLPTGVVIGSAGLLGLALDPSFAQNGYLYAYYTTAEPRNRVSRFTVTGSSASLASEFVVWQNVNPTPGDHNGGGLAFGSDGDLYISTGDQFISAYAQDLSREDGKLLRVAPNGSIPSDNPFVNDPSARSTIFARGLRNPFRICTDSQTKILWIGDVGGNGLDSWEEIDRSWKGANYGWPFAEGPVCYISNCAAFMPSVFSYRHDDPNYVVGPVQAALTACAVYRSSVFPIDYRGNLFVADYANQWIKRVIFDAQGNVASVQPFVDAPLAGSIVDLQMGVDGALYFVTYGAPTSHGGGGASGLWRIAYNSSGNLPPVAVATASTVSGPTPLAVQFSSAGSFDPDSGPNALTYFWDFGDGLTTSESDPLITFPHAGLFEVSLSVGDGASSSTATPIEIAAGNPPTPIIASPPDGATYKAGDTITLTGSATDIEDGALLPSALSWRVELVHASHVHPFLGPIDGVAQTSFVVPTSGHPPEDTHYEVYLTAADSDGLQSTTSIALLPIVAHVAIDSWPSGIPIFVDGQAENTPRDYLSLPNYQLALEAQRFYSLSSGLWVFRFWSDGGARAHTLDTPSAGTSVRAVYSPGVDTTRRVVVPASNRNAEYTALAGQAFASPTDPHAIRFGAPSGNEIQMALEFDAPIPSGAVILSAYVQLTAGSLQSGHTVTPIYAYAVGSAPPFVAGSATALDSWAPLSFANVVWYTPAFLPGQLIVTPDLSALIQEVVDRGDWAVGHSLGFVFDGSTSFGSALRSIENVDSGTPAQLIVEYAVHALRSPLPPVKK